MNSPVKLDREVNPFPFYEQMRNDRPVFYDRNSGLWNIFRYDDVQRVLSDYNTFSSQFSGSPQDGDSVFAASMISTDPPRHRQLRGLVTQAFTPRAVEALAPRIQQIVDEQLDRVAAAGEMDAIRDLGYPLPVTVIAELLGIPAEDRQRFKHWSDMVVTMSNVSDGNVGSEEMDGRAVFEMSGYFLDMIQQRRQSPGTHLISGLVKVEVDGQKLEVMELLGFCSLLLVAGNETTTNLIGNAILTFTEHPQARSNLRERPDLLPGAIEEVLRFRSPVQSMYRLAKEDVVLADQVIPTGSRLVAWIGSANHDDHQFLAPETFDIERSPNRHLAFGQGIHYCLGAPLARLEAKIALDGLLKRFCEVALTPDVVIERMPSTLVYGLRSVPIIFRRQ